MKKLILLSILSATMIVSVESSAHQKTINDFTVICSSDGSHLPAGQIAIKRAGYRLLMVNGQLFKNYTIGFSPTRTQGLIFGKLWSPGQDPHSSFSTNTILRCQDPLPPVVEKPYYYPDTYKN